MDAFDRLILGMATVGHGRSSVGHNRSEAFDRPTVLTDRLFDRLTDRLTDRYDRSTDRYFYKIKKKR